MSSTSGSIRILLADSDGLRSQILAGALRRRAEFAVYGCPMEADSVMQMLQQIAGDVAIVCADRRGTDICLPVIRRLHLASQQIATVLLADALDCSQVVNAFRSGARGVFCHAEARFCELCKCIRCVHDGQIWANSQQLRYVLDVLTHVPSLRVLNAKGDHLLTEREEQVVALVSEGLSNREVAHELSLSEHTIKKYLFRIFDKVGISTRVELVLYAIHHGGVREAEWVPGN